MINQISEVNAAVAINTASRKCLRLFSPVNWFLFTEHHTSVTSPKIEAIGQDKKTIAANKLF